MNQSGPAERVGKIMMDFGRLTGLEPVGASPKRYLWTDAFAMFAIIWNCPGRPGIPRTGKWPPA